MREELNENFKEIIDEYTPLLYSYAIRFVGKSEAPDLVQEIFIKVWKNLKKFNPEKAGFKTWIFTIARNTITDYLRRKKNILFSDLGPSEVQEKIVENIEDQAELPDIVLSKMEDANFLNRLLSQLPHNYQEVLVLHYQEELTFEEISQALSKPLNTVKSWHRRAIIQLREIASHQNGK
jgi:RNA polymerase sigma factor (sigma-70 family)